MPNSYTVLYIHHVSAVKYREALILPEFEDRLHLYIVGLIKELGQFPIQVNGMPDHIHIAARLKPTMAPSVFVQKIKANSSKWINEQRFLNQKFSWQVGGGTFSVSRNDIETVKKYIINQKAHHGKHSFKTEYLNLLRTNDIDFQPEYLPDFFEE